MKHFYVPSRTGASCTWDEGGQKTEFGQGHLIATISAAAPPPPPGSNITSVVVSNPQRSYLEKSVSHFGSGRV